MLMVAVGMKIARYPEKRNCLAKRSEISRITCHSERSEESPPQQLRFFAALGMTVIFTLIISDG
jgi:hypothetical protein